MTWGLYRWRRCRQTPLWRPFAVLSDCRWGRVRLPSRTGCCPWLASQHLDSRTTRDCTEPDASVPSLVHQRCQNRSSPAAVRHPQRDYDSRLVCSGAIMDSRMAIRRRLPPVPRLIHNRGWCWEGRATAPEKTGRGAIGGDSPTQRARVGMPVLPLAGIRQHSIAIHASTSACLAALNGGADPRSDRTPVQNIGHAYLTDCPPHLHRILLCA